MARGAVVIVGSGLAGLSCALELRRRRADVVVVSPARPGCDGASHRVHALAPWILITAPWSKGDSPERFRRDLMSRGAGLERPEVCAAFAEHAASAAREVIELLELAPIDGKPTLLPGDEIPRGLRCLPRRGGPVLGSLVRACSEAGVRFAAPALAVGLLTADGRIAGVVVRDRRTGARRRLEAGATVLACGGSAAVFPVATGPRWCRGSGLALADAAGALLHHPNLTQALPVTAGRPRLFPSTAVLTGGAVVVAGQRLPAGASLDEVTVALTRAERAGGVSALRPDRDAGPPLLPPRVRALLDAAPDGAVPLTVAVHHGIGGVAIDAWGRASLPGLYACGEAVGGAQGKRRTMGTGLVEARIFGVRAAQAVAHDLARDGGGVGGEVVRPPAVARPDEFEQLLDRLLAPLAVERAADDLASALAELGRWPVEGEGASSEGDFGGLRRGAAQALLLAEQRAQNGTGVEPG